MSEKKSKGSSSSSSHKKTDHQEKNFGGFSHKNSKGKNHMFGTTDLNEAFKSIPKIDLQQLMKSHRKNMDTIQKAQHTASELLQSLSTLNTQYIRQSFEDLDQQAHSLSGNFKNFEKPQINAEAVLESARTPFDRAVTHCKKASELVSESTAKIFDTYKKRFEEGLTEAKIFLQS